MVKRKGMIISLCIACFVLIATTITFSLGNPNIKIIYQEEVYKSNESFNAEWYSNDDEIKFTVDLKKQYESYVEDGGALSSKEVPFTITAKYLVGSSEENFNEELISINEKEGSVAEYEVVLKNTLVENNEVFIEVIMAEDNIWQTEKFKKSFKIKVDKIAPKVEIINFPENDAVVVSDKLSLEFNVTEDNLNKEDIVIVAKKNGEVVKIDWKLEQNKNVITYKAESYESGVYEFQIYAKDKAGNDAEVIQNQIELGKVYNGRFQFQRSGKLEFYDIPAEGIVNGEVKFAGYIHSIRDIDICYKKNEGTTENIATIYDENSKKVSFAETLSGDGKYRIWAEWKVSENSEKIIYDIGTYIIDSKAPIITINNVAQGNAEELQSGQYEEVIVPSISISDDNLVYNADGTLNAEKNKIIITYGDGSEEIKTFDNTTVILDALEEEVCSITVESTDAAENNSKKTVDLVVDTKAPQIAIEIENEKAVQHYKNTINFTASIIDATLSFENEKAYNELELVRKDKSGKETVVQVINLKDSYNSEGISLTAWSIRKEKGKLKAVISGSIDSKLEGEYSLRISSKDSTGKESSAVKEFVLDTLAPVTTYNGKDKVKDIYGKATNLTIEVKDEYLNSVEIICSNENEIIAHEKYDQDSSEIKKGSISYTLKNLEQEAYKITVVATDIAGNEYNKEQNFIVDTGAPKINLEGIEDTKEEVINSYNEDKTIKVTISDITLDKKNTRLVIKKDGKEIKNISGDSWEGMITVKDQMEIKVSEEGLYQIEILATDRLANISEKQITFRIDGTKPVFNMDGISDESFVTSEYLVDNLKLSVEEENYQDTEYNPEFKVTKDQQDISVLTYEKKALILIDKEEIIKKLSVEGHYLIEASAQDKAGNIADSNKLSLGFTVDDTAPKISFEGIENNSLNGEDNSRELSIIIEEKNYATNKVVITALRNGAAYDLGEFASSAEKSSLTKKFTEDGKYEITVEATDAAGNSSKKKLSFLIDATAPTLEINGFANGVADEESGFVHYNSTQNVSLKVSDNNLKINEQGQYVMPNFKVFEVSNGRVEVTNKVVGNNSWRENINDDTMINDELLLDFDFTTVTEDGKYEIEFSYTDNCGNTSIYEVVKVIIDGINPEITLAGLENDSYNNMDKTLAISVVEENFKTNAVEVIATKDGEPYNIGTFINSNKESVLSYNFNQDGLYTVSVSAKDFAGNVAGTKNISFTIDKTAPAITITGIDDGEYYNVSKNVEISILDLNHQINTVAVTRNGATYNIGEFSLSGSIAALNYNFSEEGVYVLSVESTDKAGNKSTKSVKFTIDKTAPVITPMISGKDTVIKDGSYINEIFTPYFKLDNKEDSIVSVMMNGNEVTGAIPATSKEGKYAFIVVAKDKAGNETELSVSFTIDITKPEVVISGIIDGFFNKNVKPVYKITDTNLDESKTSVTLNGEAMASGTSLKEEGEYILKAVGTDLATNATNRTIIFTIDKTSPKIEFVEAINGKYFTESIIPELLISDLSEYTIISQTLNGEPYELGEAITEDGKYVLSLEVVDKAGNSSTVSVEFIIDQTPPKFIYSGAQNGGKYYETVNLTVSLENPFDTIKEVLVNGEVAPAEFTEENGQTVVKMKFTDIGEYKLDLFATDEAGNETREVFTLTVAEKTLLAQVTNSNKLLVGGAITGFILLLLLIFFIIRKGMKKNDIIV